MSKKPNIVYILLDDMGYGDVSAFNPEAGFRTPGFDRLASEGMSFHDAHASAAVCTPSRYSLITGRYNWRSCRKSGVNGGFDKSIVERDRVTIAHMLKEQGYNTACIGKWHLGWDFSVTKDYKPAEGFNVPDGIDYTGPVKNTPVEYGFDYFYGIAGSTDMPPYVYVENDHVTAIPDHTTRNMDTKAFWREGPCAPDFSHVDVLPNFTRRVLAKIEEYSRSDIPFFVYFPMPAPHAPMLPLPQFIGKSGTNAYGDFVLMCDDIVAQVNNKIKELGLEENTIVAMASDNGVARKVGFDELKACGHNPCYHFRGHKADIYEGGHRIPLIVKWPAVIPQNTVCDETVGLCDFYATVADFLGWKVPDNVAEDSVSNRSLWENPSSGPVRKYIIHQSIDGSLSIRHKNYKLEMCPGSGGWSFPAPGEETPDMPKYQLYDLDSDIGERNNIINEEPEIFRTLKAELRKEVLEGRSTPGKPQKNTGADIWDTVNWINE